MPPHSSSVVINIWGSPSISDWFGKSIFTPFKAVGWLPEGPQHRISQLGWAISAEPFHQRCFKSQNWTDWFHLDLNAVETTTFRWPDVFLLFVSDAKIWLDVTGWVNNVFFSSRWSSKDVDDKPFQEEQKIKRFPGPGVQVDAAKLFSPQGCLRRNSALDLTKSTSFVLWNST